jgi:cysteine desulfurase
MVSIMVPGIDSETLIVRLDEAGFEVSAGSACSSGSLDPSHVLTAMGIPRDDAFGSLRVSFDERVTVEELDAFCDSLLAIVADLTRRGRVR